MSKYSLDELTLSEIKQLNPGLSIFTGRTVGIRNTFARLGIDKSFIDRYGSYSIHSLEQVLYTLGYSVDLVEINDNGDILEIKRR